MNLNTGFIDITEAQMPRIPKIIRAGNGDISMRLTIPRPIVLLVEKFAARYSIELESAFGLMFGQISSLLNVGQASFLGPMYEELLKEVRDENFGAISSGTPLDLSKLHRNQKLKSGFHGVYANGNGFRAVAPGGKYITTAPTAEEAAWRRYLYHRERGLPYGELEIEVDKWRANGWITPGMTMRTLITTIMSDATNAGTDHLFREDAEEILRLDDEKLSPPK